MHAPPDRSSTRSRVPLQFWHAASAIAVCILAAAPLRLLSAPAPAAAEVEHGSGFSATVDGFRGWYGSYRLGDIGEVWCVDHGIPAPDAALGYEPATLDDRAPDTRRAIAWAVGRHGPGADRITAAALMLVLHDLMGAAYPSGPLDVERLSAERLSGFEGAEAELLERARAIKADAVERAVLTAPLSLVAEADQVPATRIGSLRATLRDGGGMAVAGVTVHPEVTGAMLAGHVERVTSADGLASWPFEAGAGHNRFILRAHVPGIELMSLRPTKRPAQRVARPSSLVATAETTYEAAVPRRFAILKKGDAEPDLPVAGARFAVSGVDGELTVRADGRTPSIELLPGRYTVTETSPPPGYDAAGPWEVEVGDADLLLEVLDTARRGRLRIEKVDAVTGEPLDGAVFTVAADRDDDPSTFETAISDPSGSLLAGRYAVIEVAPPFGYRLQEAPVVVEVVADSETVAVVENFPLDEVVLEQPRAVAPTAAAVTTTTLPPPPPPPAPAPAEVPPPAVAARSAQPVTVAELPRTGAALGRLAASGLLLIAAGALLVGPRRSPRSLRRGASSSGRPGRRAPRPRPRG